MNDTPADVRKRYRRMLLERSGAERVAMACDMFAAARMIIRAVEMRVQLFLRTYGRSFDAAMTERILQSLRARRPSGGD